METSGTHLRRMELATSHPQGYRKLLLHSVGCFYFLSKFGRPVSTHSSRHHPPARPQALSAPACWCAPPACRQPGRGPCWWHHWGWGQCAGGWGEAGHHQAPQPLWAARAGRRIEDLRRCAKRWGAGSSGWARAVGRVCSFIRIQKLGKVMWLNLPKEGSLAEA